MRGPLELRAAARRGERRRLACEAERVVCVSFAYGEIRERHERGRLGPRLSDLALHPQRLVIEPPRGGQASHRDVQVAERLERLAFLRPAAQLARQRQRLLQRIERALSLTEQRVRVGGVQQQDVLGASIADPSREVQRLERVSQTALLLADRRVEHAEVQERKDLARGVLDLDERVEAAVIEPERLIVIPQVLLGDRDLVEQVGSLGTLLVTKDRHRLPEALERARMISHRIADRADDDARQRRFADVAERAIDGERLIAERESVGVRALALAKLRELPERPRLGPPIVRRALSVERAFEMVDGQGVFRQPEVRHRDVVVRFGKQIAVDRGRTEHRLEEPQHRRAVAVGGEIRRVRKTCLHPLAGQRRRGAVARRLPAGHPGGRSRREQERGRQNTATADVHGGQGATLEERCGVFKTARLPGVAAADTLARVPPPARPWLSSTSTLRRRTVCGRLSRRTCTRGLRWGSTSSPAA